MKVPLDMWFYYLTYITIHVVLIFIQTYSDVIDAVCFQVQAYIALSYAW